MSSSEPTGYAQLPPPPPNPYDRVRPEVAGKWPSEHTDNLSSPGRPKQGKTTMIIVIAVAVVLALLSWLLARWITAPPDYMTAVVDTQWVDPSPSGTLMPDGSTVYSMNSSATITYTVSNRTNHDIAVACGAYLIYGQMSWQRQVNGSANIYSPHQTRTFTENIEGFQTSHGTPAVYCEQSTMPYGTQ